MLYLNSYLKLDNTNLNIMMIKAFRLSLLLFFVTVSFEMNAQNEIVDFPRNRLALVMGNAHLPSGVDANGEKVWKVLPSWGLDYDYRIDEKWAIGIHTDMFIETFEVTREVDNGPDEIIERSSPFSAVFTGSRKFGEHFTLMAGYGQEFSKEETLSLLRIGAEYGWEIGENWELGLSLMFDDKFDTYTSWTFGVGVSKFF
ncbi:hypothetical protein BXY85_3599 [Roseivirga pacifica]|uniref:Outer membrane protein beta-barrel domain-containing protein n=2 Tax=Roseivirga pacifica TaxID=1267423 RepID=A0A1I0QF33_9BACT|nr:hypothetical protein [Roseivirga pacifica]RKQ42981.1 hypothetical protein BXY85_3599 [Roseivirga pacifica]SEW25659.1 hypothetical protein SAMN05216290_2276 [Roseivirga pacifica]